MITTKQQENKKNKDAKNLNHPSKKTLDFHHDYYIATSTQVGSLAQLFVLAAEVLRLFGDFEDQVGTLGTGMRTKGMTTSI